MSLASIVASIALPVIALWLYRGSHTEIFLFVLIVIPTIIIVKHHQNIRRLLAGTESRIGAKKTA